MDSSKQPTPTPQTPSTMAQPTKTEIVAPPGQSPTPANQTRTTTQTQSTDTKSGQVEINSKLPKKTSSENIRKQTKTFQIISSIIILVLVSGLVGTGIFTASQNNLLHQTMSQINSTRQGNINLQSAMQFINTGDVQIDLILNALPGDETQLVEFVRTVETIGKDSTINLNLSFNAQSPSGTETEKLIPFKISLASDPQNFVEFLTKFEKLPYIIEIITIESERVFDSQSLWNYDILANIYVKDTFKQ